MSGARRYLARLDPAGHDFPPAATRLLLLTGQSSFSSSALRAEQVAFLRAVAPPGVRVCWLGFPWHRDLANPGIEPGLLAASWRNARQWWWTRRGGDFATRVAGIVALLRQRTQRRVLMVTGSCGIQFLAAALAGGESGGPAISVFALGPVGRAPTAGALAALMVAQGRRDGWSRFLWGGTVEYRPPCGHLDYYRDPDTVAAARRFLAREAAR